MIPEEAGMTLINSQTCPCCSGKIYDDCCQIYLSGHLPAPTPEALMRSRYTAYSMANITYIEKTMQGSARSGFDACAAERWAKRMNWIKLEVKDAGSLSSERSFVEFLATMVDGSRLVILHEKSDFTLVHGLWYYTDGFQFPTPKKQLVYRNALCPCGSQRKYKNCHDLSRSIEI